MGCGVGGGGWLVEPVPALRRGIVVAAGYGLAVLVATLATVLHMGALSALPDDGAWGSFHAYLRDWPGLVLGGMTITAPFALPGFLLVVTLVAVSDRRDRWTLTLAGGLNAFPALWLAGFLGGGPGGSGAYFVFCCFGGGLAGGYAYWLLAERWLPPVRFLRRQAASGPGKVPVSEPGPSGS